MVLVSSSTPASLLGEGLDKVPWGRGRQACATGWQWSLGSGRLQERTGEHFGSTVEGAEPLSPAL